MHYYSFNIGDYASHTSRLSPMEDLSYRRLLDLYYLNEQPLNGCASDVAREVGLLDHVDSVEYVLSKFFTKDENVFRQKRIDLEIKIYKSNYKNKVKAGKASAKARQVKASKGATDAEQVLSTSSTGEQLNINQEPLTIIKDKDIVETPTESDGTKLKTKIRVKAAKPKESKSAFKFNDAQIGFARYMYDKIKSVFPHTDEPNFDSWANDVRMMEELDKRSPEGIFEIFEWAHADLDFWQANIKSPKKLRKQWSELHAQQQRKSGNAGQSQGSGKLSLVERARKAAIDGIRELNEKHG